MSDIDPTSAAIGSLQARMDGLEARFDSVDGKLDRLLVAANMGRGAWWLMVKTGGFVVLIGGALFWIADHFSKFFK